MGVRIVLLNLLFNNFRFLTFVGFAGSYYFVYFFNVLLKYCHSIYGHVYLPGVNDVDTIDVRTWSFYEKNLSSVQCLLMFVALRLMYYNFCSLVFAQQVHGYVHHVLDFFLLY